MKKSLHYAWRGVLLISLGLHFLRLTIISKCPYPQFESLQNCSITVNDSLKVEGQKHSSTMQRKPLSLLSVHLASVFERWNDEAS
jgi:hypothetical protein